MEENKTHRGLAFLLFAVPAFFGIIVLAVWALRKPQTIKVGILHSMTGHTASSERGVIDATLFAIEEINEQGGLLGKTIEPIIIDGQSQAHTFLQGAKKLIEKYNVSTIFGCWTSSSRKTVQPLVEKNNRLLFYPVQHEGLEESSNIIYTGTTANQHLIPGIMWGLQHLGNKIFLVGSDYIYSHAAHYIIKSFIQHTGGKIIGEMFIPPGSDAVTQAIEKIQQAKPDIIINTISGATNFHFFTQLKLANIDAKKTPTIAFSLTEDEIHEIGPHLLKDNYVVWSYFQDLHTRQNNRFVHKMKEKYGPNKIISDPAEGGYISVHLWANAVKQSGSSNDVSLIKKELAHESLYAPQGVILIDEKNFHIWKKVRISKVTKNGRLSAIWNSKKPIQPVPFPSYKSKDEWNRFLLDKYNQWGKQWEPRISAVR